MLNLYGIARRRGGEGRAEVAENDGGGGGNKECVAEDTDKLPTVECGSSPS